MPCPTAKPHVSWERTEAVIVTITSTRLFTVHGLPPGSLSTEARRFPTNEAGQLLMLKFFGCLSSDHVCLLRPQAPRTLGG